MMYSAKNILIGIDDSDSSKRALEYVADLTKDNGGFAIHVFHAVGPIPSELREFRGAENPKIEQQLESELHQKRDEWFERVKTQARPLLENARVQLSALGIRESAVTVHSIPFEEREEFIDEILRAASTNHCGTIVVGQSSFPWFKELFSSHTGEELLKQSKGFGVCVVH